MRNKPISHELNTVVVADAMALLKTLKPDSIPLIIADPPYGIGYHSNHYKDKNPHAPVANDWNFPIAGFIKECKRTLIDGGALYLFSRWDVFPLWMPSIMASSDLRLKTKIVWVKNNWSAGDLNGSFGNQYEEILFITKGRHLLRGKRWPNVWEFDRVPATQMWHPTQKPTPLLRRAIEASSDPGDLVVDPFAGSGSTGEATSLAGRSYLLGDIDPRMVNMTRKRLGLPLLEGIEEIDNGLQNSYAIELPEPIEWGMHPEEMRFVYDELQGNVYFSPARSQMALPLGG